MGKMKSISPLQILDIKNENVREKLAQSIVDVMERIQDDCAEFDSSEVQGLFVPGVYMIQNKITLEGYIGESDDILKRWRQHLSPNYSNKFLHKDVQKYGWQHFRFFILERVEGGKAARLNRESYWIRSLHGYCYNKGVPTKRKHIPEFGSEHLDSRITKDVYEAIQEIPLGMLRRQAAENLEISLYKINKLIEIYEQNVRDYSHIVEIEFLEKKKRAATETIQRVIEKA